MESAGKVPHQVRRLRGTVSWHLRVWHVSVAGVKNDAVPKSHIRKAMSSVLPRRCEV